MSIDLSAPAEKSKCLNCGSHVQEDLRRVHGDDENVAHRCPDCDSYRRLMAGSAAGKELPHDPQESPGRHGGEVNPYGGESA
jgi:DNA-directed RNA polymerase subunit RPC12/RpoP